MNQSIQDVIYEIKLKDDILTPWEIDFVDSIENAEDVSENQEIKLYEILDKTRR